MSTATWTALADPKRRALLDLLREQDCSVGELVQLARMTQPQASKHLRVLREAGLVSVRRDAQRRVYALDARPMTEVDAWLAPYRDRWNTSLDRLGRHLAGAASGAADGGPEEIPTRNRTKQRWSADEHDRP